MWVAVIFSGDDPAKLLGVFTTKELAIEAFDKDDYTGIQEEKNVVNIMHKKQHFGQCFLIEVDTQVSIDL